MTTTNPHPLFRVTPWREAYDAWTDQHSEPQTLDFPCPRCHAPTGQACVSPRRSKVEYSHTSRQDRMIAARHRWHLQAVKAADAAADAADAEIGVTA